MVNDSCIECQFSNHLLRRVPSLAYLTQVKALVSLAETLSGKVAKQWQMTKCGDLKAEKAIQVDLLGGREQKVTTAHHLGDKPTLRRHVARRNHRSDGPS